MNNEPVAWMQIHYKDKMCVTKLSPVKTWEDDVPLYLHPTKELSDEEIDTIVRDFFGEVGSFYDFRLVIRRCIRKAQQ